MCKKINLLVLMFLTFFINSYIYAENLEFSKDISAVNILETTGMYSLATQESTTEILYGGALVFTSFGLLPYAGVYAGLGALYQFGIIKFPAVDELEKYRDVSKDLNDDKVKEQLALKGLESLKTSEKTEYNLLGGLVFVQGLWGINLASTTDCNKNLLVPFILESIWGLYLSFFQETPTEKMLVKYNSRQLLNTVK